MFIYLIDYNYNNWYYVGKTSTNISKRFNSHVCSCRKNKTKHHKVWNKSLDSNNQPEIIILEETNKIEINNLERWYIAYFKSIGVKLTNLTTGGDGLQGHIFSNEHKQKISHAKKGKVKLNSKQINAIKMANSKPRSEEFKNKIKIIRTGTTWSEETKKKISESNKGKHNNNSRQRKIAQIDIKTDKIIKIFDSINEAALYINSNKFKSLRSSIECAANPNGKQKTACGYKWEYKLIK
jgi:group I intron endonuclease